MIASKDEDENKNKNGQQENNISPLQKKKIFKTESFRKNLKFKRDIGMERDQISIQTFISGSVAYIKSLQEKKKKKKGTAIYINGNKVLL